MSELVSQSIKLATRTLSQLHDIILVWGVVLWCRFFYLTKRWFDYCSYFYYVCLCLGVSHNRLNFQPPLYVLCWRGGVKFRPAEVFRKHFGGLCCSGTPPRQFLPPASSLSRVLQWRSPARLRRSAIDIGLIFYRQWELNQPSSRSPTLRQETGTTHRTSICWFKRSPS